MKRPKKSITRRGVDEVRLLILEEQGAIVTKEFGVNATGNIKPPLKFSSKNTAYTLLSIIHLIHRFGYPMRLHEFRRLFEIFLAFRLAQSMLWKKASINTAG